MISLYDMLEAADGQLFGEPVVEIFTDLAVDVAHVVQGSLFVALRSNRGDGHLHIEEAVARGALGVVCMEPPDFDTDGITVMIVRDAEQALMNWARIVMEKLGTTVIAVTGAAGKSTARDAVTSVLSMRYNVYSHPGNFSGRLGLPLSLGRLSAEHELAVLTLDADQPGGMAELVSIVQPLVGLVTTVGASTSLHSLMDDPAANEMMTLIGGVPEGGLAVLNFDDPHARQMSEGAKASVFSFGIDSFGADLLAYNIVIGRYKTGFDLRYGSERLVGHWTRLLGRHQLYAVMGALAVGLGYQIPLEDGLRAIRKLEPLPGRLRPLSGTRNSLLVDDTFRVNQQSFTAALEWLGSVREDEGRLFVVVGDVDEHEMSVQRTHRQLGEQIAGVADVLVTQGNLAAITGRAALDFGMARNQVRMTFSYHYTCAVLRDMVGPHDVILVKGNRLAGMGEVVRRLLRDDADRPLIGLADEDSDADLPSQPLMPSWVEVDLSVTASNMRKLRELVAPEVAVMAVVADDALGHGAVGVASTALFNGANYLGVGSLAEAVALRDAGLEAPILIMGHISPWALRDAIRFDLSVSISSLQVARLANRVAAEMRKPLRVHIAIDSGMGRLGLSPGQVLGFFRNLMSLKNLQIEGIFTELAAAAIDPAYTRDQLATFEEQFRPLLATGISIPYVHAADTAAILRHPESHYTMVRVSASLHGLSPGRRVRLPDGIRPSLSWKTVIAQTKALPRSSYVGEGLSYRAEEEQRIAVIPVGFADGLAATPQPWREVLVRGRRVPVIGRIGANEATLNVSDVPAVREGDEVVLIGHQGDEMIAIEEVAGWLDTDVTEVLVSILPRVPRQ